MKGFQAFQVVQDFERALCEYVGAPFCVTTTSCTMALLLAVKWHLRHGAACTVCGLRASEVREAGKWECARTQCGWQTMTTAVSIPKRTYVGVPMSIIHAGGRPTFRDEQWSGAYRLNPLPIWDSARRFRLGMYQWSVVWDEARTQAPSLDGEMVCVSFHWSKVLGIQQGGAIFHADPEADRWLRKARFDGRTEGVPVMDDTFDVLGFHAYMSPEIAAEGLVRLSLLKGDEPDLPWDQYPDLSMLQIFK